MLSVQPTIPIHLRIVEAKNTVFFHDFDVEGGVAGEELVGEGAVGGCLAHEVGFVDYGADGGVFVEEDGGEEGFVGEVGFAEV